MIYIVGLLLFVTGLFVGMWHVREKNQREQAEKAAQIESLQKALAVAEARYKAEKEYSKTALEQQVAGLQSKFQSIASDLMQREGESLRMRQEKSLRDLLNPFESNLKEFKDKYIEGNAVLKTNIDLLRSQAVSLGKDAEALAEALRGNNKMQGNWGEAILAQILELSGLQEGVSFEQQVQVKDEKGNSLYPDVLVHLPHKEELIIDAKVSLDAFINYVNAKNPAEQASCLKQHVQSVRNQIKLLASKSYEKVVKNAVGYVLLFIPNEAAYVAAVSEAPDLAFEAYKKHVILINPTNLLMALQLVYNLWQSEKRNQNVQEIYLSAEKVYKKFVLFAETFVKIGTNIQLLENNFRQAEKQLCAGRGNIVSQLEKWKKKGMSASQTTPETLKEKAELDEEEPEV